MRLAAINLWSYNKGLQTVRCRWMPTKDHHSGMSTVVSNHCPVIRLADRLIEVKCNTISQRGSLVEGDRVRFMEMSTQGKSNLQ